MESKFKIGELVEFYEYMDGVMLTRIGKVDDIWYDEYHITEISAERQGYYYNRTADHMRKLSDSEAMLLYLEDCNAS